ncbi:MAG: calcium-translocating P-type ATPase, PMCA-type [Clostridiaceae bacterium]
MIEERELSLGLTDREAEIRLKKFGPNELSGKKKKSLILIFISQFNDLMIWVLLASTIISCFMGDVADAITIIIIVMTNGILGFLQEFRTEKSLEALKNLAAPTCKVIRSGNIRVINAVNLTVGDFVELEAGDRIPADGIFIKGIGLTVDESLLTGESAGVNKDKRDKQGFLYMGTTVLKGKGVMKVSTVGMGTEMGKIAGMLQDIQEDKSPLKERLESLGKMLVFICLGICSIVTVVGIARGNSLGNMFMLGVSLAVAAIPEGLPAIVTVSLALGVSRMLKRNALVRKLPAVETLGCTSIICSDKTGTLTQNKVTAKEIFLDNRIYSLDKGEKVHNSLFMKSLVYCNDCSYNFNKKSIEEIVHGDPTEAALVKAFFKDGMALKAITENINRVYEIPFDSVRKMMSVIIRENGKETCYTKGAPERILERCTHIAEDGRIIPLSQTKKRSILNQVDKMSERALRCLASAYKEGLLEKSGNLEKGLIFLGVVGSIDPPREEARDAVLQCKLAGIRPVMITGDHKNTAFAIAKSLSICNSNEAVITGDDIERFSDKELERAARVARVFARVSPNHKLRIVKVLKRSGNIVAMTGDGVNDAPAIKEADIGISMGISGTDVTKEASSMILMDDNFATIVAAVEEGRVIYDNIRKFIRYLLSCNLGEVLTMFLASIFYMPNPLTPIQILFVNLATDGLPAIALGVDPPDKDIMAQQPRKKSESIFAGGLTEKIAVRGTLIGICTLMSFLTGQYLGFDIKICRTIALCTLVMSQLIHVFECRSERHSILEIKLFTNPYLVGAVSVSILMILSILYIPFFRGVFQTKNLNILQWGIVIFFSGIIATINSIYLYIKK